MAHFDSSSQDKINVQIEDEKGVKLASLQVPKEASVEDVRKQLTDYLEDTQLFLNVNDYPILKHKEVCESITDLIRKGNLVKVQPRIESSTKSLPKIESKKLLSKNEEKTPSIAPVEYLSIPILGNASATTSNNKSNDASPSTMNEWLEIFNNCNLFKGIVLKDANAQLNVSLSISPVSQLKRDIHKFNSDVCDTSTTAAYLASNEVHNALIRSKLIEIDTNFQCPFVSFTVDHKSNQRVVHDTQKKTLYTTCTWDFPRFRLYLFNEKTSTGQQCLQPSDEFRDDIEKIFSADSKSSQCVKKQYEKLQEKLGVYGHVYPESVLIGAQLYHTDEKTVDKTVSDQSHKEAIYGQFQAVVGTKSGGAGAGAQSTNVVSVEVTNHASTMKFEATGGNTLLINNITGWISSVGERKWWRVIKYGKLIPSYKLLDEDLQKKVDDLLESYNASQVQSSNTVIPKPLSHAAWKHDGVTVAGGKGPGPGLDQLYSPMGICVADDDDQTIVVADYNNHRIIQWKKGDAKGKTVAGGHGKGNRLDQLNYPNRVLIDKNTNSLIISDRYNERVVRWSRDIGTLEGEVLVSNIYCSGLALDEKGCLYVSETKRHEVRRYELDKGDKIGTVVAGGHGSGNRLDQLYNPYYIFVDQQQNVYVSDYENYRVMKWSKGAPKGEVVAGGEGYGNALTQLPYPTGIYVDASGDLYVSERRSWHGYGHNRVSRWSQPKTQGSIIVGNNDKGARANQFDRPEDVTIDKHGNLYVVDSNNHRVQRFSLL